MARRLLTLAEIYDGGARSVAARIGGIGLQTVRDWVLRLKPTFSASSVIQQNAPVHEIVRSIGG